jgi:hypothetical protein
MCIAMLTGRSLRGCAAPVCAADDVAWPEAARPVTATPAAPAAITVRRVRRKGRCVMEPPWAKDVHVQPNGCAFGKDVQRLGSR